MGWLQIETEGGKMEYLPGETVSGSVRWELNEPVEALEVRLFWYTRGKGTQDVAVEATQRILSPALQGAESFGFALPEAPYSFSGKLISVLWAVEIVTLPAAEAERVEFVMSPTGKEILLPEGPQKQ